MRYLHNDNRDKPYVDWRLPENRLKMCVRSYGWRMKHRDVDHYTYNGVYMETKKSPTKKPMTYEQRLYFSMLFGLTYQSSMAWAIYWHFPNIEKINFTEMQQWSDDNYARQHFAKDTKYNKGKFTLMLRSIHEKVLDKHGSLTNWVSTFDNFDTAFNEVMQLHKYGRMCSWLTTQTLYELCNLKQIKPKNMLATDPSNWSVRSGIAHIFNREELMDLDGKRKYTQEEVNWIKSKEDEFINLCQEVVSEDDVEFCSPFTLETHLCQYKKMICTGGDAPGTPTQDAYTRWYKLKEVWPEIDYSCYLETLKHPANCVKGTFQNKILMLTGSETGQMINMHEDNEDLPDMYKEFNISNAQLTDFSKYNDDSVKDRFYSYVNKLSNNNKTLMEFI